MQVRFIYDPVLPCMLTECLSGATCEDLSCAIDLDIIKLKANVSSQTTNTRAGF